ncbi:TetR family transcriptional regulator [Streptomyces sp. URMC 123]|uniref:TetR/AcrR family transcriptional regulator n=1 Tax=Streptomyces sp. URMC 123 TaxID=3423403 RepID=UPI003F1B0179
MDASALRPSSGPADEPADPAGPAPRPRRSDATRAAILEAARERFAGDGYERATIRAIAKDAGVDPSMVMRYYGNKEGLFAAASHIDLRLPDLAAVPRERLGEVLVHHFMNRWEADDVLTALLRVAVTNPAGAERVRTILRERLAPVVAEVCPDPAEAATRAMLASTQIIGMALHRYVLRMPPAVELSRAEVVAWLAPTVQRYLTAERP